MANFSMSDFQAKLQNIAASYGENADKLWLSYKIAVNRALDSNDFAPAEMLEALAESARKQSQKDLLAALRAGNNVVRAIAFGERAKGKAVKYSISSANARKSLSQTIAELPAASWHAVRDEFKDFFKVRVVVTPAKRSAEDRLAELAAEAGKLIGGDKRALDAFIANVKAKAAEAAAETEKAKAEKAKASAADKLAAARAAAKAA